MEPVKLILKLAEALVECDELFHSIRGDWTDPRSDCRAGGRIVTEALQQVEEFMAAEKLKREATST